MIKNALLSLWYFFYTKRKLRLERERYARVDFVRKTFLYRESLLRSLHNAGHCYIPFGSRGGEEGNGPLLSAVEGLVSEGVMVLDEDQSHPGYDKYIPLPGTTFSSGVSVIPDDFGKVAA